MHAGQSDHIPPEDDSPHATPRRGELDTSSLDVDRPWLHPLVSFVLLAAVCLIYIQVWIWMFRGFD